MLQGRFYRLSAMGAICALGNDHQAILSGLLSGDQSGITRKQNLLLTGDVYVGAVPDGKFADQQIPESLRCYDSRNNRLLLAAYQQIAPQVASVVAAVGSDRIGIVLGTSTSGVAESEQALALKHNSGNWPEGYHYGLQEFADPALFLADLLDLNGPAYSISTACSSSAKVFGSARRLIEAGLCDAVLVGGVDSLCRLTVNGFAALESIAKTYCSPFSEQRDGINIGEAAALFLVTAETSVVANDIYFLGMGESSDAHHISAPHPEGLGAAAAMEAALRDAQVAANDVAYINLHGTGTPQNDAMESKAVARVLGSQVPASSTKAITGHTLGAAGALEAAFGWLLLSDLNEDKQLPPQVTRGNIDTSLAPLNLVGQKNSQAALGKGVYMSNSFAFGGSNASLILAAGDFIKEAIHGTI